MDEIPGARMPKACRTCAKAKVRCEPEVNGVCKREVSVLEAKLDRMVELLAASEKSREAQSHASHSPRQPSAHPEEDNAASVQEDEALMDIVRKSIIPLFPFIFIPEHLTAEKLRRERPFLYLNLTMVTCQHAPRQHEISETVKQYIAEHIVVGGEHSMDLLQGLLVYLSWFITVCHVPDWRQISQATNHTTAPQFQAQSAQLDVFTQLAMAQVISLNLNKGIAALRSLDRPLSYLRAADFQPNQIPARTLEERRIYLGCYYISVMFSICVRDMEPVRFTQYTQECCDVLQEASECPADAYLVQLIRVVHLADKVHHTTSTSELGSSAVLSTPLGLIVRGQQAELQQIKKSFSCGVPYSALLSMHYHMVEIIIYRVSLGDNFSEFQPGDYSMTRLDLLFRCLEAVKSFFFDLHSVPSEYFPFFPFTVWCQSGLAMVTLSRLILFQGEKIGWDRTYVRSVIDLDQTADNLARKMKDGQALLSRVNQNSQYLEPPEIIERVVSRMQIMKAVHRKRLEAQERANPQAPLEPPDFSFFLNMPIDALFPYGHYGEIPSAFDTPSLTPRYF
ncbi:hypothetical protein N7520_000903 [Penicillium odoratum]|uniref:uncharacterized protein n=1 Tax=Penicillium odoratum TaxID=1167516 RepID=UPI0025491F83|nr:uncharacterized protein N7520_000903 [Penicillium odoratum]KAJ5777657.1 hypothetical protein N7520_000903 [Penicillium odoratum]